MKRVVIVAAVFTLLLGWVVNSPAETTTGSAPAADSQLATLGPTTLIMADYTASEGVPCNNSTDPSDPQSCGTAISPFGSFDTTGASVTSCTGINGFTVTFSGGGEKCELNGGGTQLQIAVEVTHSSTTNTPCAGTAFMSVVLTNAAGDTLTVTVTATNGNTPCT